MQKFLIIVTILVTMVAIGIGVAQDIHAILDSDDGWFDEETKIGWNPKDEYYWVSRTYDDLSEEQKASGVFSKDYKFKITHLDENTRKFILQNWRP